MIRYTLTLQRINILLGAFFVISSSLFSQVTVNSINELRGVNPGTNQTAQVRGYYEPGDGGGGLFRWDAISTADDNYGTIIQSNLVRTGRWIRDVSDYDHINVLWFGARGDDKPNDFNHERIMMAANFAVKTNGQLFIPRGIYQIKRRLIFSEIHNGLIVYGVQLEYTDSEFTLYETDGVSRNNISWSPDERFKQVDESIVSAIKLSDDLNTEERVVQISHSGSKDNNGDFTKINNLVFKNLAILSNREKIGTYAGLGILIHPYPPSALGGQYSDMLKLVENLRFENIVSCNSARSGFQNYGGPNVIVNNLLVYGNGWHGLGNNGYIFVDGLESHNNGFDENFYKLSQAGGYYGVDLSTNVGEIRNFHIHHNWAGIKTSVGATKNLIISGIIENNFYHGYTHTGSAPELELYIDNVVTRQNGGAGVRIVSEGISRNIGRLISENNGLDGTYGDWGGVSISGAEIEELIVRRQSSNAKGSYGARIFGPTTIKYIEIIDNSQVGLDVNSGSVEIRSGKILNNKNSGVVLGNNVIARLYNIEFGDTQDQPTQTSREIYDSGGATLYHSGLNFSKSVIDPNNRIRVSSIHEVTNATLVKPGNYNRFMKEDGVELSALAASPNRTVQMIQFYVNNEMIAEISEEPYVYLWDGMDEGEYTIKARAIFSDNTTEESNAVTIIVSSRMKTQNIILEQGWNTISTYIQPNISDISVLLDGIKANLSMVNSNTGNVYWPSLDINEIGEWDYCEGYHVYMENSDTLIISGHQVVSERTPIQLNKGWNLTGYLLDQPLPIEKALSSIINTIQLVTNNAGQIYWPDNDINSIGYMVPGQGYKLFTRSAVDLNYPSISIESPKFVEGNLTTQHNGIESIKPKRYVLDYTSTGVNSILLVESEDFFVGDEVGVWSDSGILVGNGLAVKGKVAITVWGRNTLLPEQITGADFQEALRLTLWSAREDREFPLKIVTIRKINGDSHDNNQLLFEPDAIFIAGVETEKDLPQRYSLDQNFPNPFNPTTLIRYEIPKDESVTLDVFNLLGQHISTIVDEVQPAGSYQIQYNAENLASGVYFYRFKAGNYTDIKKMILVR
jgi:hypothetical protein